MYSASAVSAVCIEAQKLCRRAMISDEPVVLLALSLAIHSLRVEKNFFCPLLSEEGGGDQKMTPEPLNEAFSAKSTQSVQFRRHKEPYNTVLETYKPGM